MVSRRTNCPQGQTLITHNRAARSRLCVLALAVLLAALARPVAAQTVLLSEDFNGDWSVANPPPGWRIYCDWGDTSTNDWHRGPDSALNCWPDNPTPFAVLDSFPGETDEDSLISPFVNIAGFNVLSLRCSTYFRGTWRPYLARLMGAVDSNRLGYVIFDYNGTTVGPGLQEFGLSWAVGHSQLQVGWVYEGFCEGISFWAIDNVSIVGDSANGVAEAPGAELRTTNAWPTMVRSTLFLPPLLSSSSSLLSIDGRKVLGLLPGPNDVRALSPGVYFVKEAQAQAVRRVILAQ